MVETSRPQCQDEIGILIHTEQYGHGGRALPLARWCPCFLQRVETPNQEVRPTGRGIIHRRKHVAYLCSISTDFIVSVSRLPYTHCVSDNRWEIPVDVTALDPKDPGVAAEVARRLASGDFEVLEHADKADPLRLTSQTSTFVSVKKSVFGCVLLALSVGAVATIMAETNPWIPFTALFACGLLLVFNRRILNATLPARLVRKELARQVRLSEMARRNSAQYRVTVVPGESLFSHKTNPVLIGSVLSTFASAHLCEVGDSFCSADDTDFFPCEWGNLVLYSPYAPTQADGRPIAFQGWYMIVALPRAVPHIVLDAKADNLGSDLVISLDPSQRVRMDTRFDSRFTVYAPTGYDQDARDLVSEEVRQQVMAIASDENIELAGKAVIFFGTGTTDWARAEPWERVNRLLDLVQETMYPRIGEYVDSHLATPSTTAGHYPLLPTNPRSARIAAQGKVLRSGRRGIVRRVATILIPTFTIIVVALAVMFHMAVTGNKVGAVITVAVMCVCWIVLVFFIVRSQLHRPRREQNLR